MSTQRPTLLLGRRRLAAALAACCASMVLLLLAPGASAATLGCADDASGVADLPSWVPEMLAATNAHRAAKGLAPVALDPTLARASVWKARDLARRNYFTHDDPAGGGAPARSPWERLVACGFPPGGTRSENIAAGQRSGAGFVQAWIASPPHLANIENPGMRYVGFGVAASPASTHHTYAVQMFSSVPGPDDAATTQPIGSDETSIVVPTQRTGTTDATDTGVAPSASRVTIAATASVTRSRCRHRLAVRGYCYRLTTRGRLRVEAADAAAGRRLVVTRRTSAGSFAAVRSTTTSSDGRFAVSRLVRPPAAGTASWLSSNARTVRVRVAAVDAMPGAARTVTVVRR